MSIRRKRGAGDSDEAGEALNGFRGVRGGGASATFVPSQAGIVRSLVSQIADLVGSGLDPASPGPARADPDLAAANPGRPPGPLDDLARLLGQTGPATPPDDPVLARLLPDAYRDDTEASFGEIAEGAGVGQATVYRHFADRRAPLAALAAEDMGALEERIAANEDMAPEATKTPRIARLTFMPEKRAAPTLLPMAYNARPQ